MKHLLTLAALLVSTLSLAQFTPYNPDADNDQFVGAQDLLAFLPLFGEDWNLDSLNIYGTSELEAPEFCDGTQLFEYSGCEGSDIWRVVPQDADVVFYDFDEEYSVKLLLPEIPRPLILFGTGPNQLARTTSLPDDLGGTLPRAHFTYMSKYGYGFSMLLNFNGNWYIHNSGF